MTQSNTQISKYTDQFKAVLPQEPALGSQMAQLSALSATEETRNQLVCRRLLVGETHELAVAEAERVLEVMLKNTQVVAVYGTKELSRVNELNERMMQGRPKVDVPEIHEAMLSLSREMRGLGKKYDPNDPKVLEKYQKVKTNFVTRALIALNLTKSFMDLFLDDISSLHTLFERVVTTLQGKQFELLKHVVYYDEFYRLNEEEVGRLIYAIGVMEIIRDLAAQRAAAIPIGDANMGDRGSEKQAQILELVNLLDNKISAFKVRLWVAWAMAPQIRTMRTVTLGVSARIDQTIGITIPTMINIIMLWLSLSETEQAAQFNSAVEQTHNDVMLMFAHATKATIPALVQALASPAMDPRVIVAWTDSIVSQAEAIIAGAKLARERNDQMEHAMVASKQVMDASTQKVNEDQLQQVLAMANPQEPLQISQSVPAAS